MTMKIEADSPDQYFQRVPQERQEGDLPTSIFKGFHEGAHMAKKEEMKEEKEGKKAKRKKATNVHSLATAELVVSEDSLRDSDNSSRE